MSPGYAHNQGELLNVLFVMTATAPSPIASTRNAWAKSVLLTGQEFSHTPLQVISGSIPEGLRGTLYRNGPARLERGSTRVGHWFDGDGAILRVNFSQDGATAAYRFVQTPQFQEEEKAGQFLYGNYGMTAPGPVWNQWRRPLKNAANTSVLALPDKLLTLWEGGKPYALDLDSLETRGEEDLGELKLGMTFSAHPKIDRRTGEIFNFGVTPGINSTLNLYRSDSTGKILHKNAISLQGIPLIHDFVLAGQYLLFFIPPVRVKLFPKTALGFTNFSDALEWRPELGTQILVIDRESLNLVSRGEAESWYQWHFANGYQEEDGTVVVDLVRFRDFNTNQYLKEVATGKTKTPAKSTFWRLRVNPKTANLISQEPLMNRCCEFPVIHPQWVGQNAPFTLLAVHREGADYSQEIFGAIARYDYASETLTLADMGQNCYPMEPIFAPDAYDSERGYVVTVVYDGNQDRSEVRVYDSQNLDAKPLCRLELPQVIPYGFHGTWKPAS